MSLTMDGVVRRGPVQVPRMVRPRATVTRTAAPAGNVRYVTGMDGLRRPVPAALSPRELVAMVQPDPVAEGALQPAAARPWSQKAAFGLVAAAVVAGSVATWNITAGRHAEARAETPAAARNVQTTPAATPDPARAAAAATLASQQAGLERLVNGFASANPQLSIVVKDLKTGATTSVGADQSLTSASLYKLFVAQQVQRMVDAGTLSYANNAGGGSGRTVGDCLTIMINISDNTCGRALGSILNWGAQDGALKADGYTGTTLSSPQQTSPKDVAYLLERLYRGTLNAPSSNDRLVGLLKDQRVNNRLPQGLPAGTTIAHKTGDLDGYMHDAGVVYGPKTDYLVVVMGKPGAGAGQFSDLSAKLWQYFEQN